MSKVTPKLRYVDELGSVEFRLTEVPRRGFLQLMPGQGKDGYGSKITTDYECRVGNKWHRVYLIQISNAGSHYVTVGGQRYYVRDSDIPDEVRYPRVV